MNYNPYIPVVRYSTCIWEERDEDTQVCKNLIRKIFTNYKMPYISITPTFSVCNEHGYIRGEHFSCPHCGKETEVWSRVVGYLRPVANYNDGKKQEYFDRLKFKIKPENNLEEAVL